MVKEGRIYSGSGNWSIVYQVSVGLVKKSERGLTDPAGSVIICILDLIGKLIFTVKIENLHKN